MKAIDCVTRTAAVTSAVLLLGVLVPHVHAESSQKTKTSSTKSAPPKSTLPQSALAPASEVLMTWDNQKMDRLDFDAALQSSVKKEHRSEFPRDMRRITSLLDEVHVRRALSARAEKAGLDQDPVLERQLQLARERLLSTRWLEQWEAGLKAPDLMAAAEEQYKLKEDSYKIPDQANVSHILIGVGKRSDEEARARAEEVLARAKAGEDFKNLVKEYSEDPSAARNEGDLGWFTREKMVKPFADAAFALEKTGDLSGVVKSDYGYHVILLHEKKLARLRTFEEVKASIVGDLEKKWRDEQRAILFSEIRNNKSIRLNAPAIDALLVK